jgi:primosomal protein N' (replication factor Y)
MLYAHVAVNAPGAGRNAFTYSIPDNQIEFQVGHAVWVPFNRRVVPGIITKISVEKSFKTPLEIHSLIYVDPVVSITRIDLAVWISSKYFSSIYEAIGLILPPGFSFQRKSVVSINEKELKNKNLSESEILILNLVKENPRIPLKTLRKYGQGQFIAIIDKLQTSKILNQEITWELPKVSKLYKKFVSLELSDQDASSTAVTLMSTNAKSQSRALEYLISVQDRELLFSEAKKASGVRSTSSWMGLLDKGFISIYQKEIRKNSFQGVEHKKPEQPHQMTQDQLDVSEEIISSINKKEHKSFLVHGVTGSGKTEIYLNALSKCIEQGKRGIVLVPEIALTPQMVQRFSSRFPDQVAVLHSGLTLRQRYDEWQNIKEGKFNVVIGSRGAVFAPQPDLGLIVIDEEHEWTYKQSDRAPRYHAREVAIKIAYDCQAVVILGSATPDLVTKFEADNKRHHLLELPNRIIKPKDSPDYENAHGPLAEVKLIDLRDELKSGNRSIFSRDLTAAIKNNLKSGQKTILFVNRRGSSQSVQCRLCGHVLRCHQCSVVMSYHQSEGTIRCHRCDSRNKISNECPSCLSDSMRPLGIGTEKVAQEALKLFTGARVVRWDSDSVRNYTEHKNILNSLADDQIDILVGTQMIAKGLDFPNITLVGVINADIGLNVPDLRGPERIFQILCQVAGRAGRGLLKGRVIVQTYSPENYAIKLASEQDYGKFYETELKFRKQLLYPPYGRIVRLLYSESLQITAQKKAETEGALLHGIIEKEGIKTVRIIGPAPSGIEQLRGKYRWQTEIIGPGVDEMLDYIKYNRNRVIDVDPMINT